MEWYWWVYGICIAITLYQVNKQVPIWVTVAWAVPLVFVPRKFNDPEAVTSPWWLIIGFPFAVLVLQGVIPGALDKGDKE